MDARYRRDVVQDVDVVCHAGTWGAFWNHRESERTRFYEPACDLIEQSIRAGVKRFIQNSAVVVAAPPERGALLEDSADARPCHFWPHLDRLALLEKFMSTHCARGTQMVTLRCGHFVGRGNGLGFLTALVPRLKTHLVPWLVGGKARMPLVADEDLGSAFVRAAIAQDLGQYESFNICGPDFPTAREVFAFVAREVGCAQPHYSVPYGAGYAFGWLMEMLHPVLPGRAPFLTRSIVHVSKDWPCATDHARRKLGYIPTKSWQKAVKEGLDELAAKGYPWQPLAQV